MNDAPLKTLHGPPRFYRHTTQTERHLPLRITPRHRRAAVAAILVAAVAAVSVWASQPADATRAPTCPCITIAPPTTCHDTTTTTRRRRTTTTTAPAPTTTVATSSTSIVAPTTIPETTETPSTTEVVVPTSIVALTPPPAVVVVRPVAPTPVHVSPRFTG